MDRADSIVRDSSAPRKDTPSTHGRSTSNAPRGSGHAHHVGIEPAPSPPTRSPSAPTSTFDGATKPNASRNVTGSPRLLVPWRRCGHDGATRRGMAWENWARVLERTWGAGPTRSNPDHVAHHARPGGGGDDNIVPGFSKSATLEEIDASGHALTPGRHVRVPGAAAAAEHFAD